MWHPSAEGLAELHEEGKVTAFPRSATSRRTRAISQPSLLEVGQLDTNTRTGWMGAT